jgi:pyruvate/2-oxoglutarate dehydrogenase complex dihydrolipoamide acyltransferase (E2) component
MATQIIQVPKMGDSITEGTLIKTVKQPGEQVALDEIVCVIETDKVSFTSCTNGRKFEYLI